METRLFTIIDKLSLANMQNGIKNEQSRFKVCSLCKKDWESRNDFLNDPVIKIIGYIANFEYLEKGLLLFNHNAEGCGTTLVAEIADFMDIYSGPIYSESLTGSEECPEYCLDKDNLDECSAKCAHSHVREIIQIVKKWPKCKTTPTVKSAKS